jgi:hypothetical protein
MQEEIVQIHMTPTQGFAEQKQWAASGVVWQHRVWGLCEGMKCTMLEIPAKYSAR